MKAGNGSDGLLSEAHAVGSHGSDVRLHRRAGVQSELSFPRQVQVFCFLLSTFVAPVRPTSAISVGMIGGRDCLLGWGCIAATSKTIRLSKLLGVRNPGHDVPLA